MKVSNLPHNKMLQVWQTMHYMHRTKHLTSRIYPGTYCTTLNS